MNFFLPYMNFYIHKIPNYSKIDSMNLLTFHAVSNSIKGAFCGLMTLTLIYLAYRYVFNIAILRFLRFPLVLLGPPLLYPLVILFVFRFQLPPLDPEYIRRKWYLWIPGFSITCMPLLDILLLDKSIISFFLR
jgi:hypothetical protein